MVKHSSFPVPECVEGYSNQPRVLKFSGYGFSRFEKTLFFCLKIAKRFSKLQCVISSLQFNFFFKPKEMMCSLLTACAHNI